MKFELDEFNVVIIDPESLPDTVEELKTDRDELLFFLDHERKSL